MDASKVKRAQEAKSNAFSIVQKYMNLDDYDKLYAYKNEICDLVEYDNKAAGKGDLLTINDPWQLISVFDNDNTTNVVCEGYSKAFAYLCENSNFQNNIKCYIVTRTMKASTEGGHMRNIITMENGKNYMVDITNCDGNGVGDIDQLFLAGLSGNVDAGYTFTNKKVIKLTVGKNIEHIGKNAFRGCKNLEKIVFKTKKLTTEKIGSNAFKGINSRAKFVTPE